MGVDLGISGPIRQRIIQTSFVLSGRRPVRCCSSQGSYLRGFVKTLGWLIAHCFAARVAPGQGAYTSDVTQPQRLAFAMLDRPPLLILGPRASTAGPSCEGRRETNVHNERWDAPRPACVRLKLSSPSLPCLPRKL